MRASSGCLSPNWRNIPITLIVGVPAPSGVNECNGLIATVERLQLPLWHSIRWYWSSAAVLTFLNSKRHPRTPQRLNMLLT